jgi:hypothetical protein
MKWIKETDKVLIKKTKEELIQIIRDLENSLMDFIYEDKENET